MKFFKILSFVLVSLLGTNLFAQDAAAVLADVARPVDTVIEGYNKCIDRIPPQGLTKKMYNKRVEVCEKLAFGENDRSKNVAKSAAKANQPQISYGGGYGYGTTYNTGGFVRPYNEGYGYYPSTRTNTSYSGGGTVRGYASPTTAPTPAPQKPGPPGVK